ncbi:MAG TPA: phenylalanine--tRNA ligase subunit alpha [Acidimicrobiia bacterium]
MDPLEELLATAPQRAAAAGTLEELETLEAESIGKSSALAEQRRALPKLPAEERPQAGARLQRIAAELSTVLGSRRAELEREAEAARLEADRVDVTLPGWDLPGGYLHLINQTIDEVCEIFIGLGYQVAEGPEAELAWYNFDALNTPPTHPARLETDTLYLDWGDPRDEILLRTHTSPMQVRWMESHDPPTFVVVPGTVYRADPVDATHLPVFHQIEGLAVAPGITMSDLKGTLAHFARQYFGPGRRVKLQPNFFPFTEPSAEMAASCFACDGSGCRVCAGTGWIELMGCGMVDPAVFTAVGYDPAAVTGFAFGMGPERLAMIRHGIESIRYFVDNDMRVLRQFR